MSELNENISVTVDDAPVATVPLVNNLTADNAAPKASTVGAALALKADAATIMENVTITVDGQESDAQGVILLYGEDIPVDESTNAPSVTDAIEAVEGKLYGDQLPVSGTDATKISAAIASAAARTASDITYASGSADTIADKVGGIDTRLTAVEETCAGIGTAAAYGVAADTSTGTAGVNVLDAKVGADLQAEIDTLNTKVNATPFIVTEIGMLASQSVEKGETAVGITIDVPAVSGYRAAGVVGYRFGGTNVSWLNMYKTALEEDEETGAAVISFSVRNVYQGSNTNTATMTAYFKVLYIRIPTANT